MLDVLARGRTARSASLLPDGLVLRSCWWRLLAVFWMPYRLLHGRVEPRQKCECVMCWCGDAHAGWEGPWQAKLTCLGSRYGVVSSSTGLVAAMGVVCLSCLQVAELFASQWVPWNQNGRSCALNVLLRILLVVHFCAFMLLVRVVAARVLQASVSLRLGVGAAARHGCGVVSVPSRARPLGSSRGWQGGGGRLGSSVEHHGPGLLCYRRGCVCGPRRFSGDVQTIRARVLHHDEDSVPAARRKREAQAPNGDSTPVAPGGMATVVFLHVC